MNVVRPKIHVKGFPRGVGIANEVHGGLSERLGHQRTILPRDFTSAKLVGTQGMFFGRFTIVGIFERQNPRAQTLKIGQRLIKTVFGNQRSVTDVPLAAHVPFAEVAGRISCRL